MPNQNGKTTTEPTFPPHLPEKTRFKGFSLSTFTKVRSEKVPHATERQNHLHLKGNTDSETNTNKPVLNLPQVKRRQLLIFTGAQLGNNQSIQGKEPY